ncbi:MAG TPA: hypothetical protein PK280_19785 [Planctomycetota bacterium]|nr:hypothetical protein [Planctomycetota bacterium]
MRTAATLLTALFFASGLLAGESAPPAFTKKPSVAKAGDPSTGSGQGKVKIDFTVDRETDVAVYVDDAQGRVVRHLAAGALGKNPPEPLKPGLAQSLEWDGKDDDGKPAAGGPFKVRVGLGLRASWGGLAFTDPGKFGPNMLEGLVTGIAAGPDGRAYVGQPHHQFIWGSVEKTLVFLRDGAYEKTIVPFSPNLPMERLKPSGAFVNSFGTLNPRHGPYRNSSRETWFYPVRKVMFQTPAVAPGGRIYMAGLDEKNAGLLTVIDTDGGIPEESYAGAAPGVSWLESPFLAASSDGKSVYAVRAQRAGAKGAHAVLRIRVPERTPAEVFFGETDKAGNDEMHLSDPRAVALDGKGNLLVADSGNNRVVVVKEADGSFVGSFPVDGPIWVGAHLKTGAVYVLAKGLKLIKFSGWKDAKELASQELNHTKDPLYNRTEPVLALDATAEPAVVWMGANGKGGGLVRWIDEGGKFAPPAQAGCYGPVFPVRAAADPTHRMVVTRVNRWGSPSEWRVLDDETGQVRVAIKDHSGSNLFAMHYWPRLDRDGNLYGVHHCGNVRRYGPDGKPKPFPATANNPWLKGDLPAGATGTTAWERDYWIDRKGDIYVRRTGAVYHATMSLEVYDQQGNYKRTALWSVTDGMYGPRVDSKGNLVILDVAKPKDAPYPKEFTGVDPAIYDWFYGSVIKFGPQGGAIWILNDPAAAIDFEGWRSYGRVADLRTTGGCLTGQITGRRGNQVPGIITVPGRPEAVVDADKCKTVTVRLKNGTDGTKAAFGLGRELVEGLVLKTVEIKPNSDFAEYTFDLSDAKEWKGQIGCIFLSPSNTNGQGSFAVDWIKLGTGADQKTWDFNAEDSAEKRLPADMKKEPVRGNGMGGDGMLQGALWHRQGFSTISTVGGSGGCHCFGTDFDVDDFGRIFAPDACRFRIGVLDANGNEITSFGAYGNQDNCGPDSYVLDPAGKFLRPRKADDPKDLVSPFAKPEVPLAWVNGVAVTDRHAFITDCINKRILRVKMGYAVAESCEVR